MLEGSQESKAIVHPLAFVRGICSDAPLLGFADVNVTASKHKPVQVSHFSLTQATGTDLLSPSENRTESQRAYRYRKNAESLTKRHVCAKAQEATIAIDPSKPKMSPPTEMGPTAISIPQCYLRPHAKQQTRQSH